MSSQFDVIGTKIQILGGPDDGDVHYIAKTMVSAGVVVVKGKHTYIVIEASPGNFRLQYVNPARANGG